MGTLGKDIAVVPVELLLSLSACRCGGVPCVRPAGVLCRCGGGPCVGVAGVLCPCVRPAAPCPLQERALPSAASRGHRSPPGMRLPPLG